jgi:hypothetical protein
VGDRVDTRVLDLTYERMVCSFPFAIMKLIAQRHYRVSCKRYQLYFSFNWQDPSFGELINKVIVKYSKGSRILIVVFGD